MRLHELFVPDDLIVGFDPVDKWDSISRLVEHLAEHQRIPADAAGGIGDAVLNRERSMSTGMEHGIAIPHAAVESVESVCACMGIIQREGGLGFESIDGRPSRLVVLLIIPRAQKLLHIRTLADIARVLGKDSVRESLLAAGSADAAWSVLQEAEL